MTSVCELNAHGNLYGNIYAATYGKYMSSNVQQGEDSFVRPQVMASCQEQVKALSLHHSHRGEHFHPAHQHSKSASASASASSPKMKPSACQSTFFCEDKTGRGTYEGLADTSFSYPKRGIINYHAHFMWLLHAFFFDLCWFNYDAIFSIWNSKRVSQCKLRTVFGNVQARSGFILQP